jgi:hypothetical protein
MPAENQSPKQQQQNQKILEIAPGVSMRLRGAKETYEAVEHDFYGPATCISCELLIFCILNAEYVLCPDCRVVSPFEGGKNGGGVGLGFTMDNLACWQNEIMARSRRNKKN